MRLLELVVEDFRKLEGCWVVRPAATGITVVSGDNEDGKSTLLDALKRAFFMKHNTGGEARDAIQPLGQPQGRNTTPAVTVAFRIADATFRLEKQFRRGGVKLEGPNGTLEGDAAENELARLLAFDWPGRGAAKTEQMGLAGLFWVDQGTTFDPRLQASPTALRTLQPALAGELASLGRGERAARLMAEIKSKSLQFFTAGRGQKRGELAELEKAVATLRRELDEVTAEEREVEGLLDRLAQTIERRRAALAADQLGRARAELERSRATLQDALALQEQAKARTLEQLVAQSNLARLEEQLKQRRALAAEVAAKTRERTQLLEEAADALPSLEHARQQRLAADAATASAQGELQRQETRREALARQAQKLRLERDVARLAAAEAAVRAAVSTALEHEARATAEPVTAEKLAALEELETTLGQHRAALSTIATRLVLHPNDPAAVVTLAGAPVAPGQKLELTAPAVLELAGFGRIEVTPGGERLSGLAAELCQLEQELATGLEALHAATIGELRRRLAAKDAHQRDAAATRTRLADQLAAAGVVDREALEAATAAARSRLAALAAVELSVESDEAALEAAVAAADDAVGAARIRLDDLRERSREVADAESELGKAAKSRSNDEARLQREIANLEDQQAIAADALDDQALDAAIATARATADRAAAAAAALERELARAEPEQAKTAAEQAERRLRQLEEEGRKLDREVHDLEAELRGRGAKGVGARKAELAGTLERTERLYARRLAEAEAWRLLDETLTAVDRTRQDALVAPLEARVRPYLRQLLGDAGLGFEPAGLQLDRLERDGRSEPFNGLSVGTREQLAVLVRLAIGDLLAETTGESPPLILDDALVYADAVRLNRMKAILEKAAGRQQIIILTCRKEDYLGLDACYVTLEECRSEA